MTVTIIESQGQYKDAVNADEISAIEFCAPWEEPCKEIGAKFDAYSNKFTDMKCYRVDICDQQDVAMDVGVKKCPVVHFYRKGSKIDEYVGTSYPALERKIAAVVNANKKA